MEEEEDNTVSFVCHGCDGFKDLFFKKYADFHAHATTTHQDHPLIQAALDLAPLYVYSPFRMEILQAGERTDDNMPDTMIRGPLPYGYLEILPDEVRYALYNAYDTDKERALIGVPLNYKDNPNNDDSIQQQPKKQKNDDKYLERDMLVLIDQLSNGSDWNFASVVACIIIAYRYPNDPAKILRRCIINHCLAVL